MATLTFSPYVGIHNAPYPGLQVQQSVFLPMGSVGVVSGTYTGNGTGQDINTGVPLHWWWVRPLSGSSSGVRWWSSMDATHDHLTQQIKADRMVQALVDPTGNYVMRVAGPNAASNANGVVYQWTGISDPAMRYMLNGQFAHAAAVTSYKNLIADGCYQPEALFFWLETLGTSGSTGFWFKGLGQGTDTASKVDSTQSSGVLTIGKGYLTSSSTIHQADTLPPGVAYNLWRRNDGSGNVGLIDLVTYTGDGTGSRNISCILNGRSPLFAFVQPHNGIAYYRDASNTTTHSQDMSGNDSTTALVGGDINTVKVNSTLNTMSTVYDLFVIAGNVAAGAWSGNIIGVLYPVPTILRLNPCGFSGGLPYFSPGTPQWILNRFDLQPRSEDTA